MHEEARWVSQAITELLNNPEISRDPTAGNMIDDLLKRLLEAHGFNSEGHFGPTIDRAHKHKLISARFKSDCHLIQKIRNEIAHSTEGASFEEEPIRGLVRKLFDSFNEGDRLRPFLTPPFNTTKGMFFMAWQFVRTQLHFNLEYLSTIERDDMEEYYTEGVQVSS